MTIFKSKNTILHVINNLERSSGGAQKILWGIFDETRQGSSILSYTAHVDAFGNKRFLKLLFPIMLLRYLFNARTVVIHHRMFLLFTPMLHLFRIKSIFLCHNIFPDKNFITSLFKAQHAVAISHASYEYLKGLGYTRITMIENYIEYNQKHFKKSEAPSTTIKIGYIGRLAHQKGLDLLFEACSLIAPNNRIELHIIGDGELQNWAFDAADTPPLKGRVKFHGNSNAPFSIAVNFDILVVPSRWEGFGLVFYEAIAHKHFIIASDLPTFVIPDEPTEQIVFFECGSSKSLAKTLQTAISNSSHRNYKMINNDFLQRFSKDQQIAKYVKLFNT